MPDRLRPTVLLTGATDGLGRALAVDGGGVTVNALHPATYMPTKIVRSPVSTIADGIEATLRLARPGARRDHRPLLQPSA